ncbi:MAG: recombinase family protein, partial [Pseudomonadota bacterium]
MRSEHQSAIIYCRISSLKQAADGDGLNSQEHRCRQYAAQKGYEVEAVFPDSITGGGDYLKRPGMVALLSYLDAQAAKDYVVIFDDLKRLARDTAAHIALRQELSSRGARVESLNFKFEETPEGKFIETIIAAQGQLEREQNSRQVVQKMKARVEKGFWVFRAPIGMKYVSAKGGGKVLVRDEPVASICQEALEGFASNRFASQTEMRRWLEAQSEFPKDKPNGEIRPQSIVRFLGKEVYAGLVSAPAWGVSLREGQHDGLISVATFERIQKKLKEGVYAATRIDTSEDFVLRGAVVCSECGHGLTAAWCKGKYKRYPYYFCVNTSCSRRSKTIARDKLEGAFATFLGELQPSPGLVEIASVMFTDLWDARLQRAEEIARGFSDEAKACEREIGELLDRIVEASNPRVVKAYEDRIADTEHRKLVALEKAAKVQKPSIARETLIKHALKYVSAPKTLWDTGVLELRRLVLKLTFAGHIRYCRETGIKHPEMTAPFRI